MKNISIHILFVIIVSLIVSGCITAMRSAFVKKGYSHSIRIEGPYISEVDHEGWGLLRGVSLTYELQYGWAPRGRSGFGHELGAKYGIDIWQHHEDAESKDSRSSELGLLYYISHTFMDSSFAVKIGMEFPLSYRLITGIRTGKGALYFQGMITEPSCFSCDDSKHNVFVGIGVDHPIFTWQSRQVDILLEASFPLNEPLDSGPLHVWRANKQDDNWSEVQSLSFPIIGIGFRLSK